MYVFQNQCLGARSRKCFLVLCVVEKIYFVVGVCVVNRIHYA